MNRIYICLQQKSQTDVSQVFVGQGLAEVFLMMLPEKIPQIFQLKKLDH